MIGILKISYDLPSAVAGSESNETWISRYRYYQISKYLSDRDNLHKPVMLQTGRILFETNIQGDVGLQM